MSSIEKKISSITERWFLTEPLLFSALCSHRLEENTNMLCPIRSGKMRIEYNPAFMELQSDVMIELLFRREVIRILLKHPYNRQPINAIREILTKASDYTIYQHGGTPLNPFKGRKSLMPQKASFERYYNILAHRLEDLTLKLKGTGDKEALPKTVPDKNSKQDDTSRQNNKDVSEAYYILMTDSNRDTSSLWEEDDFACERMNTIIEHAMVTNSWGSFPGELKELLKVSIEKSINIRRQLGLFKASILSNERRLTRMRPSRRYGWEQMGVIHPYTTRLLIGIDVSGSVSSSDVVRFYSLINAFFSYGIMQIDVLQFDNGIKLPLLSIKKAKTMVKVTGRGGTNFQPVINYFEAQKEYDGLIVFTDGKAPKPEISTKRRILWVLLNRSCYNIFALTPKIYL